MNELTDVEEESSLKVIAVDLNGHRWHETEVSKCLNWLWDDWILTVNLILHLPLCSLKGAHVQLVEDMVYYQHSHIKYLSWLNTLLWNSHAYVQPIIKMGCSALICTVLLRWQWELCWVWIWFKCNSWGRSYLHQGRVALIVLSVSWHLCISIIPSHVSRFEL